MDQPTVEHQLPAFHTLIGIERTLANVDGEHERTACPSSSRSERQFVRIQIPPRRLMRRPMFYSGPVIFVTKCSHYGKQETQKEESG